MPSDLNTNDSVSDPKYFSFDNIINQHCGTIRNAAVAVALFCLRAPRAIS